MSSTRSTLLPYAVLDETNLAASATSQETDVSSMDTLQYDIVWTGSTPVGAITPQYLADSTPQLKADWVWKDLDVGTINISGASGAHQVVLKIVPFTRLRVSYTHTSGTLNLKIIIKGNGN